MRAPIIILLLLLHTCMDSHIATAQTKGIYKATNARVGFHSEAPKELISGISKQLKGLVDFGKGTFIFKLKMNSFQGFNNELQREHFNENYVESSIFPEATFSGKIIESINISELQTTKVRAKGKLSLHGIDKECIFYVVIKNDGKTIEFSSDFFIALQDFNIKIPKVVYNKLASKIAVSVNAQLEAI